MEKGRKIKKHFFARLIAASFIVTSAIVASAQQDEKFAAANALFIEAKQIAETNTAESWKAAEVKFDAAFAKFIESTAPESKNEIIKRVVVSLYGTGNQAIQAGKFDLANHYFKYALPKAQAANLREQTAMLYESLGNSAVIQGERDNSDDVRKHAVQLYRKALPIYLDLANNLKSAGVYRQIGLIASDLENYKDSIPDLEESLKYYRLAKDQKLEAAVLGNLGNSYFEIDNYANSEKAFQDAAAVYFELKDDAAAAKMKYEIGRTMYFQYRSDEAVKILLPAIAFFENAKDKEPLADALTQIGKAYAILKQSNEARNALERAAKLYNELGHLSGEASARLNLGDLAISDGNPVEARTHFEASLELYTRAQYRHGIVLASISLAEAYAYVNEHAKAFEKAEAALKMAEADKNNDSMFGAYRVLGWTYIIDSRYDEGIRYSLMALKLAEEMNDPRHQADAIVNLGIAYSAIGMNEEAIRYYKRGLTLTSQSKDRFTEAILYSNIGYNYFTVNDFTKASDFLSKAVSKMVPLKMKRELAYATHNLGMVLHKLGDLKQAKICYEEALKIYIEVQDRRPEAYAYLSLGEVYADQKKWDLAMPWLNKAILLSREIKYSEIESGALDMMMRMWRNQGNPRLAVLYGKQAVNLLQTVRAKNRGLDKSELSVFVKTNEFTYRELADLLVSQGRLPEAQQVLDLLKEEELFDFVRRDSAEARDQAKVALTDGERNALNEYSLISGQLTALGARFQVLQDAKNKAGGKLPEADEAEFQTLKTQIEDAGTGFKSFLSKLANEFSKKVEDQAVITPQSIETLRADLRRVGPDVVLVSTYLLPERYRAIVTTGRTMVDRKVEYKDRKLTVADINRKIDEFRRALQNPRVDPRPLGKELYDIFVKPLEKDLQGAGAKTILWSLDGTLRYIPIAALSPDGKTYMAERYQNVIVTLGRQTNLFTKPTGDEWRALGAGVSKPHEGFAALPSVINELNSIVKENGSVGVLSGKKLMDEQFNLESFRNFVPQQTADGKVFNVIHLATHFKLGNNDQDSALLLGDGKRLSLFEIGKDESLDFKDVELLALSACETGVSSGDGSGREVESLGMLAQRKGAKAVMATLWKVADEGTSMFMSEFYRLKQANPLMSKAEAIRLTQKAMIDGKIKATGTSTSCRADDFVDPTKKDGFKCDPNAPFSHPYFWSPFVLIGNWR